MDVEDEEPTGEEQVPNSPRERRLELVVTILLAVAALLSAWCAYHASRFSGQENTSHAAATRLQVDATRADNQAGRLTQIDVTAFYGWVEATSTGDVERANFFRSRFRDEMKPAFEAWVAMDPLENPEAPATPFQIPEYRPAPFVESEELLTRSQAAELRGDSKGVVAERYLLTVVLYAAALFQLGIQSRIGVFELRPALVGVAGLMVAGTTLWVITLPT